MVPSDESDEDRGIHPHELQETERMPSRPCQAPLASARGNILPTCADGKPFPAWEERDVAGREGRDKARPSYCPISTMSTERCSSMVYAPSRQMRGHGNVLSHWSCRRLLRMSTPPSSYDAAHARNAWEVSYMSPPGRMRSPNRAYSRRWRRAIRTSEGIDRKTTNSNRGIAPSPHPQSDPDTTQAL
jgi:hypothetical protein